MQAPQTQWQTQTRPPTLRSRNPGPLSHTTSMFNLHDLQTYQRTRPPPPLSVWGSSSTDSEASGELTPTASSSDLSSPHRTTTPTQVNFSIPNFEQPRFPTLSRNPFHKDRPKFSPPVSPHSTPSSSASTSKSTSPTPSRATLSEASSERRYASPERSYNSPDRIYTPPDRSYASPERTYVSSSAHGLTPIAPIPLRPIASTEPGQLRFDSAHNSPATWHFESPASSTPTPTPGPLVSKSVEYDKLPIQQITGDLIREVIINQVHSLCARKKWNGKIIMPWAVSQPKTALLLYMCDELDAWPKAAQFAFMEMADSKHPFDEAALRGIVSNPAKILEVQWRVGIMKNLSRGGGHVEFQTQDTVPLSDHGPVGPRTGSSTIKTRVKVKYRDGADVRFYVRKRLEVHADRPKDKTAILNQIKAFTELDHTHIAKIVSSYAQGQVVAFITPHAEANLEQYLDQWTGFSQAPQLLGWVKDLASALAYIHDQNMAHRNIRPQKILVDQNERIYFSVFGVIHPMRQSYAQLYDSYSNEPGYIYGAPEVINRRDVNTSLKSLQLADVFSLGCVFLEMVSVAKGHTVVDLKKFRSQHTQDNSFHINITSLFDWINNIVAAPNKREKQVLWSNRCLGATGRMLYEEPEKRWSMTRVALRMGKPKDKEVKSTDGRLSMRRRRNSIDATANNGYLPKPTQQSAYFSEMASLQSYYTDLED